MKFSAGESYKVDSSTEITDLFEAPDEAKFDSVLSQIEGYHPESEDRKMIVNEKSQKAYYILEGSGKFFVGDKQHKVEKGEFVFVPEKTRHALEGIFRALIVTSPPFNPDDERLVERE